jgi:hypothetical protein
MMTSVPPKLELHPVAAVLCYVMLLLSSEYGHILGSSSLLLKRALKSSRLIKLVNVKVSMHIINEEGYLEELVVWGIKDQTQYSNVFAKAGAHRSFFFIRNFREFTPIPINLQYLKENVLDQSIEKILNIKFENRSTGAHLVEGSMDDDLKDTADVHDIFDFMVDFKA